MGKRKAVQQLPEPVRDALHQQLIKRGFAGYEELAAWLRELGYDISKSSLHRYGQEFEDELAALRVSTEQARAVVEATPDTEGAMSDALIRLVQQRLFQLLREVNKDPEKKLDLAKVARAVADLSRTTVNLRKYQAETREKIAEALQAMEKEGFDKGTLDAVNSRISIYLPANGR